MKINSIKFKKEVPSSVTVTLSLEEAVFLSKLTGKLNHISAEQVWPKFGSVSSEIYYPLQNYLFNAYWDDGVRSAARELEDRKSEPE